MTTFTPILTGAILIVLTLAEENTSGDFVPPPTPPTINLRDDDDRVPMPPCTANTTDTERMQPRNGLLDTSYRWKIINFYIDPSFTDKERKNINDAAYILWQVIPCVQFGIYRREQVPSRDYVDIKKGTGCSAELGRQGGAQRMTLEPPGCTRVGVVMHEMLHALGMQHEHQRPDRDDFININWENIKDALKYAFDKLSPNSFTSFGVPYNFNSIMHYQSNAFSKNDKPTITDKNGGTFNPGYVLQETDKEKLKKMYNC